MRRLGFLAAVAVVTGMTACSNPPASQRPAATPAPPARTPATFSEIDAARSSQRLDLYEAGLRNLAHSTDVPTQSRAAALLALFYENQKRYDEAVPALLEASNLNRDIAPYLGVHLMDSLAQLHRWSEAISIAQQVVSTAPGTAAATDARIALPALYAGAGDAPGVTASFALLSAVPVDEFTEGRLVDTADRLSAASMTQVATTLRLRVLNEYPAGRFTEKLYDQLLNSDPSPIASLEFSASLDLADRLGRVNRYDQALDLLGRTATRFPDLARGATFRYVRLRSLFNSRNYEEATAIRLANDEPYYLASELFRARAHWRNKQNSQFLTIASKLVNDYPQSREAIEARILLGKYYVTDEVDYDRATRFLEQAIAAGADGDQGENLWTLGWTQVVAGNDGAALEAFDRYLTKYPDSDYTSNALFWSGKIWMKRGDSGRRDERFRKLIALYPYSYYSYRARELMGEQIPPPDEIATAAPFPDLSNIDSREAEMKLAIVHQLLDVGMELEAARQLKSLAASVPDDPVMAYRMAELYSAANEPLKAMATLQKRFRDPIRHGAAGVPHRFWEILYPRGYWREIEAAGARLHLDPYLIASIIRQESAFDPTVVSNAGAVGLMQIMPEEIGKITSGAGLPPATRNDLFDPKRNTEIGAAEFTQKLQSERGDRVLAIAAYNAGEEPVGRWIAKVPTDDIDFFIESIPFNETRLYVKSVTRNWYEYRRIYEKDPSSSPKPSS